MGEVEGGRRQLTVRGEASDAGSPAFANLTLETFY